MHLRQVQPRISAQNLGKRRKFLKSLFSLKVALDTLHSVLTTLNDFFASFFLHSFSNSVLFSHSTIFRPQFNDVPADLFILVDICNRRVWTKKVRARAPYRRISLKDFQFMPKLLRGKVHLSTEEKSNFGFSKASAQIYFQIWFVWALTSTLFWVTIFFQFCWKFWIHL